MPLETIAVWGGPQVFSKKMRIGEIPNTTGILRKWIVHLHSSIQETIWWVTATADSRSTAGLPIPYSIALTARIWTFSTFVSDGLAAVRRVNGGSSVGQSLNSPNECSSISSGSFCCGCRGQRSAPRQLSYAVTLLTGMNETDSCLYCEGRGGGEFGGCH